MTYPQLKRILYIAQTAFGAFLLLLGWFSPPSDDVTRQFLTTVLILAGAGLLIFGALTYILRDDPDVWR